MFKESHMKRLPEGFADNMNAADTNELKAKILESEQHLYEIDQEKEGNEKLKQAKEMAKEIGAPFRDARNTEAAKIKYCLHILESRGVAM